MVEIDPWGQVNIKDYSRLYKKLLKNIISYKKDLLLKTSEKNIYSCLVKPKKDFGDKNFTLRTPTINIVNKEKIITLTKIKYGDFNKGFLYFIKALEKYLNIKFTSLYKAKYRYLQLFKKNKANIIFLRVISLCLTENIKKSVVLFNNLIIQDRYIKINNLKLPIGHFNKTISYLNGVISGDGHLDKIEHGIWIVDGQSNKKKLILSKKYLKLIYNLFKREFNIRGQIYKEKTWYVYRAGNKCLCRFFNYYFEIPFGKKNELIKLPKILANSNEKFFWRGLMDTDGYIDDKKQSIRLKSSSKRILYNLKDYCEKKEIIPTIKKDGRAWSLDYMSADILKFSKTIGFNHPRKKAALIKHLKKGPSYKVLKKVNKKIHQNKKELFKYLRPYKKDVYIKLNEHHKRGNKKDISILLKSIRKNFNIKIIETKRNRYNNHFYICSKEFTNFVKKNALYSLPWQPLSNEEIRNIEKDWTL